LVVLAEVVVEVVQQVAPMQEALEVAQIYSLEAQEELYKQMVLLEAQVQLVVRYLRVLSTLENVCKVLGITLCQLSCLVVVVVVVGVVRITRV
jgi:hypothetical protein